MIRTIDTSFLPSRSGRYLIFVRFYTAINGDSRKSWRRLATAFDGLPAAASPRSLSFYFIDDYCMTWRRFAADEKLIISSPIFAMGRYIKVIPPAFHTMVNSMPLYLRVRKLGLGAILFNGTSEDILLLEHFRLKK